MKPIIKVEGISKQYRLGAAEGTHDTLRDMVAETLRTPLKRLHEKWRSNGETLWALKDVTFRVEPGEVLGIIGRNGAGKSTLLKVLSRITEPTSGRVELYGRFASLLEVGTGFHPELTGRENIFLNGAILGMRKTDITRRFEEIVSFAEIEKFIDTPVKRYSSGMYVRLAFAVAAHLEPDILILDEVLAVGDASFQKRCLGKMRDVTKEGRTVLLVSHNMAAIKSFCSRALLLEGGRIVSEGSVDEVTDNYLTSKSEMADSGVIPEDVPRSGTGEVRVRSIQLLNSNDQPLSQVYLAQPFRVVLTLEVKKAVEDVVVGIGIASLGGTRVTSSYNIDDAQAAFTLPIGFHKVSLDLNVTLLPRQYTFDVAVAHLNGADIDVIDRTLKFEALAVSEKGLDHYRWSVVHGFIRLSGRWQLAGPTAPPGWHSDSRDGIEQK